MDKAHKDALDAKINKIAADADAVMSGRAPRHSLAQRLLRAFTAPVGNTRILAKETGFPEKVIATMQAHGSNVRQLMGRDADGDEEPALGLVMDALGNDWRRTVKHLRKRIGPEYVVFCAEQGFTQRPDQIAVLRGTDPFGPLHVMKTSGPNYDIDHEQVLARVSEWDQKYGLDVMGAGHDWLEAEFQRPPADMNAFAQEVYEFCPDVVDQGTETVERLASEMKSSKSVYVWWD